MPQCSLTGAESQRKVPFFSLYFAEFYTISEVPAIARFDAGTRCLATEPGRPDDAQFTANNTPAPAVLLASHLTNHRAIAPGHDLDNYGAVNYGREIAGKQIPEFQLGEN